MEMQLAILGHLSGLSDAKAVIRVSMNLFNHFFRGLKFVAGEKSTVGFQGLSQHPQGPFSQPFSE